MTDHSKLDSKVEEGGFVGYDDESKGNRVYWPRKSTVSIERNIRFKRNESFEPTDIQIEGENWDIAPNVGGDAPAVVPPV